MVHRGPDDAGEVFLEGDQVGLVSRRLAIIDLSPEARQPMSLENNETTVVFNGEIYNYIEIRRGLEDEGVSFRTSSDTEVILRAYERWGADCLARINGMFAFAIWNRRLQQMFVARDRFGEKPFYYHVSPRRLVFASEIKALLLYPDVPKQPDDYSIFRYLTLAQVDGEESTFFQGIRQLRPAHYMTVSLDGELRTHRYWNLNKDSITRHRSIEESAHQFRELFLDSIRLRLRSDVPVGSSLSGGIDSSSVVGAIHALLDGRNDIAQSTFSARHPGSGLDEGRYIDDVLNQTQLQGHSIAMKGEDLLQDIDRLVWHQEEPFVGTSQYAQYKVMQLARNHGVTVLLDGQGADEILGGYHPPSFGGRFAGLLLAGRPVELINEMLAYKRNHQHLTSAGRYMVSSLLPKPTRLRVKMRYWNTRDLLEEKHQHLCWDRLSSRHWTDMGSPLKTELYETLTHSSLPSLLRYGDRNSMAFSREARLPFLDHRLVEFVFSAPDEALVSNGTTKVLLRESARGLVPEGIRLRMDKIGFATPEVAWFKGPLLPWIDSVVAKAAKRDLYSPEAVHREWTAVKAGQGNPGTVWRIVNLELWMQKFF